MHRINRGYAQRFNAMHGREGHVFERRYRSWIMPSLERQMEAIRYIVRNPVRAGLCSTPEEWLWSSHRATAGMAACPPFLSVAGVRGWFDSTNGISAYREFVDAGIDEPQDRPSLGDLVRSGSLVEIAEANQLHGYALREIAVHVGLSPATLSRRLRSETLEPGTGVSPPSG